MSGSEARHGSAAGSAREHARPDRNRMKRSNHARRRRTSGLGTQPAPILPAARPSGVPLPPPLPPVPPFAGLFLPLSLPCPTSPCPTLSRAPPPQRGRMPGRPCRTSMCGTAMAAGSPAAAFRPQAAAAARRMDARPGPGKTAGRRRSRKVPEPGARQRRPQNPERYGTGTGRMANGKPQAPQRAAAARTADGRKTAGQPHVAAPAAFVPDRYRHAR